MKIRWKGFELPSGVECDQDSLTDTYGRFWIEPFERGFGTTMGNTLRRILLSSIQGSAITSARIEGIRCEFENLDGVLEDTTEMVLNLKQVYIRMHTDEPVLLTLEKAGPGKVTAADLSEHQDIEIMNPDQEICTLSDDVKLSLQVEVRKGRGFVLARDNMEKSPSEDANAFSIDSIYSPVQKVAHKVAETRVGQKTDYERLELEIWTNGIVTPSDALTESAAIMRKHINPFLSYNHATRMGDNEVVVSEATEEGTDRDEKLRLPISVLEPSARTRNCLEAEGIESLGQLVCLTEHDLMKFRNFGSTSMSEIKDKLAAFNLEIGQGDQL
jgi:DNA-directed RNA polymerase subunit alpha